MTMMTDKPSRSRRGVPNPADPGVAPGLATFALSVVVMLYADLSYYTNNRAEASAHNEGYADVRDFDFIDSLAALQLDCALTI